MEPVGAEPRTIAQRYVVVERIATRGPSRLYTATQAETGRNVVVREYRPTDLSQPDVLARVSRIAAVTSRFLATLLDAAPLDEASIYVAHELLSGESLATRLARKVRFTAPEASAMCVRMLKGLDALHARDQVHGALRPTRVFHELRPRHGWHVKLLGAGIESVGRDGARADATLGRYAPPEWLEGAAWSQQSDVFCAGLILFECVVGRPAYEASTRSSAPPDLAALAALAPPALVELLRETLSRTPEARPAGASALLDRLLAIFPEEAPQAKPVTQRSAWTRGKFVGKEAPVGFALPRDPNETRATSLRRRGDLRRARWTAVAITACLAAALVVVLFVQTQRRERRLVERLADERDRSAEALRLSERAARERGPALVAIAAPVAPADAAVLVPRGPAAVALHAAGEGRTHAGERAAVAGPAAETGMGVLEVHVATPCTLMLDGVTHGESTVMQMLARDGTHELTCAASRTSSQHLLVHVHVGQRTLVRFNQVGQADISMEPLPPS